MWKLVFILALCPTLCTAGAWARGTGKAFVSTSTSLNWPVGAQIQLPNIYGSAYLEYGVSPRLTLGVDLGTPDITRSTATNAIGFARYTLTQSDAPVQISMDLGGGALGGAPAFRAGASIGRGITAFRATGWVNLDLVHLYVPSTRERRYKADGVIGLNNGRWSTIATLSLFKSSTAPAAASITPSLTRSLGKGRKIEVGITFDVTGNDRPSLKIGLWKEF